MLNKILMGVVIALLIMAFIPPILTHQHQFEWEVTTPSTCTLPGVEMGHCKCGKEQSRAIQPLPHQYGDWTVVNQPTCTNDGSRTSSCQVCGKVQNQTIAALGHDYGQWIVDVPNTCTTDGSQYCICQTCGYEQRVVIPPQHKYENFDKCTVCGEKYFTKNLEYTYSKEQGGYVVSGIGRCKDTTIVIADKIQGKPVVAIADYAFRWNYSIKKVTIGANVKTIGNGAFESCTALTSVVFAENSKLTKLGNYAFARCELVKTIQLPNTITSIGMGLFHYCYALETVNIPTSLTTFGTHTFNSCTSLTTITIPANIQVIGEGAFSQCTSLKNVIFEEGCQLTTIESQAFCFCIALESITIPSTVTRIENEVFDVCSALKSIKFADTNGWVAMYNDGTEKAIDVTDDGKNAINFISREIYGYCICIKK
ncbi:MAG: leucine-rich repeat domain-containing protein [Clostridia bacterium]|nr:leucine-rich repeat domain-containing protein [Clostridia bacterium]